MKKSFILLFFFNFCLITLAQTDGPTFAGISMKLSKEVFVNELLNSGFKYNTEYEGMKLGNWGTELLKGNFQNFGECRITIKYASNSGYVTEVIVFLPNYSSNKSKIQNYIEYLDNHFDCRIVFSDEEDYSYFSWFAKDKTYSIDLKWKNNSQRDECDITFYSEKRTLIERKKLFNEVITSEDNNY